MSLLHGLTYWIVPYLFESSPVVSLTVIKRDSNFVNASNNLLPVIISKIAKLCSLTPIFIYFAIIPVDVLAVDIACNIEPLYLQFNVYTGSTSLGHGEVITYHIIMWDIFGYSCPSYFILRVSTYRSISVQWRHNGPDGVSNHKPYDCLLSVTIFVLPERWL